MKLLKLLTIFLLINLLGGCAKDIENLSGDVFGKVTDTSTGEPLKSATVLLTPGGKSVTTGEHGTFEFKALTAGQYELQIKKEGYETNTKQIVVTSGSVASGDMALAPVKKVSKVEISANVLDFGTTHSSLTFDIKNIGNTGEIDWTISGVDVDWISVTPITGTTDAGKSSVVKVVLDRTKVIDNHSTNIIVNADGESFPVTITAKHIEASTKVKLSTDKLDFGTAFSSLTFEIENITIEEDIDWTITGIDVNWFTVSAMQGSTNAGKNSVIKVELDRTKLLESKSTNFIVNADGYSFIMTVSASPMEESTKIKLSTNKLDFGKTYNSLTFDIENIGNAGAIDWTITGIDVNWLSVNPAAGKTEMGKSNVIKVELDRSKLTETSNTNIIVNAGGESFHIAIMVEHNERVLEVFPRSLAIGVEESKSFDVKSLYGSTRYELITSETESWLSVLHTSGTIPEYDPNNQETVEDIKVLVNREGMDAGNYSSTLILRSDLGDIEIPVSMIVEKGSTPDPDPENPFTIISCDKEMQIDFVNTEVSGTTVEINFTMTNNGTSISAMELYAYNMQVFDDLGNSYTETEVKLGSKEDGYSIRLPFPSGIKMKGTLTIKNVHSDATLFQQVITPCYSYTGSGFDNSNFTFKNVIIPR